MLTSPFSMGILLQNKTRSVLEHTITARISGATAVEIAASVEAALRAGAMRPGERLPTVRALATRLRVSPTTVAAAYRSLRQRGLVVGEGRRGSAISHHPPITQALAAHARARVPERALDLANGNPDPRLLPALGPALREIDAGHVVYGGELCDAELERLGRRALAADGISAEEFTCVSGALDGIERALAAWLRPGDRVAVEDPGFPSVFHLVSALGLVALPVAVDESGPLPDATESALRAGARALIVTPRAQNPFGAALDERRVRELRALVRGKPDLLVLEDDHGGAVAGAPARTLCTSGVERWALVRSVSKALGPDLRLAFLVGDPATVARIEGRFALGSRWVSHLLQRIVARQLADAAVARQLRAAERTYTERRQSLLDALAERELRAYGRSGMNVWVPVPDEEVAAAALLDAGYAVATGARFRLKSEPGLRITTARLPAEDAAKLADALAAALRPARRSASA
jgi:DNA-binding transcriptional MocR family regulator